MKKITMKKIIRLNENDIEKLVKKIIREEDIDDQGSHENYENKESNNYMFWQNLKTIQHAAQEMLAMDRTEVDRLLNDGHGWALDHIATSSDDIEEVYHFLEGNGESEMEEAYLPRLTGKIIEEDEFGSVELLPLREAEYKGRKVTLGKPFLTPDGPKKRSVYVKNDKDNVVKVNFGDPNMRIKKSNPERRKSFRARHHCDDPGPRHKARYWSCKAW